MQGRLPWICWVALWYFWYNRAHMNSHCYNRSTHCGEGWCCLGGCFLRDKEIQFGWGGESYCMEAEGEPSSLLLLPRSCTCNALDTCSSQSWSLDYARAQRWWLTPFARPEPPPAGLRQAGRRAAELCSVMGGFSLVAPVRLVVSLPLVPLGSRGRAALRRYKTQLCWHSCNHTRECFASVVYSSCIR